VLIADIVLLM